MRLRRGHHVFIFVNLPSCNIIHSSWKLSDLLGAGRFASPLATLSSPEIEDGRISPFPNVLCVLGPSTQGASEGHLFQAPASRQACSPISLNKCLVCL